MLIHSFFVLFYIHVEPAVASSDATNMECSIRRYGAEYEVNGTKWWSSGMHESHDYHMT